MEVIILKKNLLIAVPLGLSIVLGGCSEGQDERVHEEEPAEDRPVEDTDSEFNNDDYKLDEEETASDEDEEL
jgi:hypothetical protein